MKPKQPPIGLPQMPENAVYLGMGGTFDRNGCFWGWMLNKDANNWDVMGEWNGDLMDQHYAAHKDSEIVKLNYGEESPMSGAKALEATLLDDSGMSAKDLENDLKSQGVDVQAFKEKLAYTAVHAVLDKFYKDSQAASTQEKIKSLEQSLGGSGKYQAYGHNFTQSEILLSLEFEYLNIRGLINETGIPVTLCPPDPLKKDDAELLEKILDLWEGCSENGKDPTLHMQIECNTKTFDDGQILLRKIRKLTAAPSTSQGATP